MKFSTADEFNALPREKKMDVVRNIVEAGWQTDASGFIDQGVLLQEINRVEKVAYAIGDFILDNRDTLEEETGEDVSDVLCDFMGEVASWSNQCYAGEYRDHDDGFWVSSNC